MSNIHWGIIEDNQVMNLYDFCSQLMLMFKVINT